MTNFEKITETPETLAAFLASIPIANGPWDKAFHQTFCVGCRAENCDVDCPHEAERNNPAWWLNRTVEGEPVEHSPVQWDGRLKLEPGMFVALQEKDPAMNGACVGFNVYLNGKGPEGEKIRGVKKALMPTVVTREIGDMDEMSMELVLGGCEEAAEVIKKIGQKCKLEIRTVAKHWDGDGGPEYHGHCYILEAVPLEIKSVAIEKGKCAGLTIRFRVYRYTATMGKTKLWDFKWVKP